MDKHRRQLNRCGDSKQIERKGADAAAMRKQKNSKEPKKKSATKEQKKVAGAQRKFKQQRGGNHVKRNRINFVRTLLWSMAKEIAAKRRMQSSSLVHMASRVAARSAGQHV
jgi:hypothetical protein